MRGRPKKFWLNHVQCDVTSMGVADGKTKVRNREDWRTIVWEAEVHPNGL